MDPRACFIAMLDNEHDVEAYNGYKSSLIEWLDRGGFGPLVKLGRQEVTLVKLTWTSDATIKFANNRRKVVKLRDIGY